MFHLIKKPNITHLNYSTEILPPLTNMTADSKPANAASFNALNIWVERIQRHP